MIKTYCQNRLSELFPILTGGTPWGFLCLSSYVDFLAKLESNNDGKQKGYKQFFSKWFPKEYTEFTYSSGKQDLPEQFYHVFRCGLCHSFSLVPDSVAKKKGGRIKSISISHDGIDEIDGTLYTHLSNYTKNGHDSAILIGGDLCKDLSVVIDNMFKDESVQRNSEAWVSKFPPINSLKHHDL